MVAEDDTDIREVLSRLLQHDGHTVIAADDGETPRALADGHEPGRRRASAGKDTGKM
jgi:CheY-like chemotaxis protein